MIAKPTPVVLYNGATGSLGRHMVGALRAAGLNGVPLASRLEDELGFKEELHRTAAQEAILIHLAARVSVPACEADPAGAHEVNVVRAAAVLDQTIAWAQSLEIHLRVVYVSSGHVYETPEFGARLREDAPTAPRSVYATTKLAGEAAFRERATAAGLTLRIARVFGLLAPGQPVHYVLPALIARVREQRVNAIRGLDMVRDYLDARDVCRDLLVLALTPLPVDGAGTEVVNICSGDPTTIRELLAEVLAAHGDPRAVETSGAATAASGRPDDVAWLVGDPSLFIATTGVDPRSIPLAMSVRDAVAMSET